MCVSPRAVITKQLAASAAISAIGNRQVQHSDFQIGTEFFTETGKWRCTDVGARVIVAISLEPREMVRTQQRADGERIEERFVSDDPRDLAGPPYMVVEHVFDEYSIEGCYATEDEVPH
jgi:hypothetical protein